MADEESKQQKLLELDLTDIPDEQIDNAKADVGQFVIDSIVGKLASGQSPVRGERFKKLSKSYADKQKDGDRTPNLYLTGDMQSALGFDSVADGIVIGIMSESERPKADGHNNFSGESKLPQRRFIPGEDQNFKSDILNDVDRILDGYRVQAEGPTEETITSLKDLLSSESIAKLLAERLNR